MKAIFYLILILIFVNGCNSNPINSDLDETFSIYLVKVTENNTPDFKSLTDLELEEEPLLSANTIDYYEWGIHKITYPDLMKESIKSEEPLFGRYFVVIADGHRIYWGMFTDSASSMAIRNPVIMLWSRSVLDTSFVSNSLVISKSYVFEPDNDLRNDSRIHDALINCGKLR